MIKQFKTRAEGEELMDDFSYAGADLFKALEEIAWVNRWLGGQRSFLQSLQKILKKTNLGNDRPIHILDLGCGSGDYLRGLSQWGEIQGKSLQLVGVDANSAIVDYAAQQSATYNNIRFECADVLADSFDTSGYDIVLCGLFLHHLSASEQLSLVDKCLSSGVKALVVNDLQRHWLAYYLFRLICWTFNFSRMSKHDGALSVRKAFKRAELKSLAERSKAKRYELAWKWAFRFQLILYR